MITLLRVGRDELEDVSFGGRYGLFFWCLPLLRGRRSGLSFGFQGAGKQRQTAESGKRADSSQGLMGS